jgi:ornithine carbamoyltransferase
VQNFLSILDLDPDRIAKLLDLPAKLKRGARQGHEGADRGTRSTASMSGLLFEKPSLRTPRHR